MSMVSNTSLFSSFVENNIKHVTIGQHTKEYSTDSKTIADYMHSLKYCIQVEKSKPTKIKVSNDILKQLDTYLETLYSTSKLTPEKRFTLITELYRCLRNSVTNDFSQNFICFETNILDKTRTIICSLEKEQLCLKIILQFLINLTALNNTASQKVHSEFLDLIINFVKNGINVYECSALIYNISLLIPLEISTVETMFNLYIEITQNEFVLFFIEKCIENNEFWNIYDKLKSSDKLVALEALRTQQIQNKQYHLPESGVKNIVSSFLKSPEIFFKINNLTIYEEVHEVSFLLEILSSLSSKDEYIKILQENKDILVTAAALLINFHRLGKEGKNLFTPIQKLSETGPEESNNPVFGLKVELIRLIGNMCWKNMQMQELAREAEVIPIILDCCNIDAKNPFIIQWCIFSIRNLCENNIINQKLISGLHQQGVVSSQVLDEFGITLNNDEGTKLKIVPLDSLKRN